MPRALQRAGAALLGLAALAAVYIAVQANRHPSLEPYRHLTLPADADAGSGVRVRFAGTTTLVFDDGRTAWMTDGFFTRPPPSAVLFGRIGPDAARIDRELARLEVTKLAAVVPVHSHYDHAMDAPLVARRTGALLVGSSSTLNVGRGLGLGAEHMREVRPGDTLRLGRFTLSFIASRHSPTPFSDGETPDPIVAPLVPPARATAWREGETWSILVGHDSGFTALVQGSAGFLPGSLSGRRADTVFLGIGTLGGKDEAYREAYWNEVVKRVGAKRVIPIHWDAFWRPLDEPLVPMPLLLDDFGVAMDDLLKRAGRGHVEIRLPPAFVPFVP